jgi:hypothetical protein
MRDATFSTSTFAQIQKAALEDLHIRSELPSVEVWYNVNGPCYGWISVNLLHNMEYERGLSHEQSVLRWTCERDIFLGSCAFAFGNDRCLGLPELVTQRRNDVTINFGLKQGLATQ